MSTDDRRSDLLDVVVLATAYLVAIVAIASLAAAYMGIHSVASVAIGSLVLIALTVVLLRRTAWGDVVARRFSKGAWLVLPALVAGVVLFFPGFRFATGDKDPGIYVMHATSIERTGDILVPLTPLQQSGVLSVQDVPGSQWRGFIPVTEPTTVTPSFYHLWPALLASGFELVGFRALAVALPLIALVCVASMFCLVRRLAGPWVGGVAALVLATNMMETWQARYPTTEMLGQLLFLGAALGLVLAMETEAPGFALVAGVLTTTGFLNRGEGVILVGLGLLGAAVAWACRVRRQVAAWYALGVLLPLPFAWLQAYDVAKAYSLGNNVPSWQKLAAALVVAALIAAAGLHPLPARLWQRATALLSGASVSRRVRLALTAIVLLAFAFFFVRPKLGQDYFIRNSERIRSWDERSLHRLALFFGWPALLLGLAGLVWAIWARWSAVRTIVVVVGGGMLGLFLLHARNSPQMMWWNRRFVPIAVPGLVVLVSLALAGALASTRWRRQVLAVVAVFLAFTLALQTRQSLALRSHDEHGGSYGIATTVAALSGERPGVFLWERGPCCAAESMLYGSPVWMLGDGDDSALLPKERAEWPAYVGGILAASGDRPVFLVIPGEADPPADLPWILTEVDHLVGVLPVWQESNVLRPSGQNNFPYDMVIYRVER